MRRSMLLPSAELLIGWARSVGIVPHVTADELHVTLCYSRTSVDLQAITEGLVVPTAGASLGYLGDKGALVLFVVSEALVNRNAELRAAGATSDYDIYRPHVTLSYLATVDPAKIDISGLPPTLAFGPEVFRPIDEDWAPGITGPAHILAQDGQAVEIGQTVAEHATISGVEIFRAGRWNGEPYSVRDLDKMVTAFGAVGYRPPVKLGHDDDPKAPAYGWVTGLRRQGDVLLADFEDVPDDLVEQIRAGRFDAVSSEIFFDLERNGKKFDRALKAVAILGAHPPGVSDLKPLRASLVEAFTIVGQARTCTEYEGGSDMPDTVQTTAPADEATTRELEQARARIAELEARNAEAARLAETSGQAAIVIREMQASMAEMQAQLAQQREATRLAEIDALVQEVKVPVFRDHFRALAVALMAESTPRVVEFATGGESSQPTPPVTVLRDLSAQISRRAATLFGEVATVSQPSRGTFVSTGEDAQGEIRRLAEDLRAKHPALSNTEAIKRVLAMPANAHLARAYAAN